MEIYVLSTMLEHFHLSDFRSSYLISEPMHSVWLYVSLILAARIQLLRGSLVSFVLKPSCSLCVWYLWFSIAHQLKCTSMNNCVDCIYSAAGLISVAFAFLEYTENSSALICKVHFLLHTLPTAKDQNRAKWIRFFLHCGIILLD